MSKQRQDPRSRNRAGYWVAQQLRREMWATARRNWRLLTITLVGWILIAATITGALLTWSTPTLAAFFAGLFLGVLPFWWLTWLVAAGFAHRSMGRDAEKWTAAELAKLDGRAWTVLHDIPLTKGNVDHVAIGPGRVYAIETKWTSYANGHIRNLARQAERRARELAFLMGQRGTAREVIPLLVVWGPGVGDALGEKPELIGRTRVVAGTHSKVWLSRMTDAADRLEIDWPAKSTLLALVQDHDRCDE